MTAPLLEGYVTYVRPSDIVREGLAGASATDAGTITWTPFTITWTTTIVPTMTVSVTA